MVERRDVFAEIEKRIIQGKISGFSNAEIVERFGVDQEMIAVFDNLTLGNKVSKIQKLVREGQADTSGLPQEDMKLHSVQSRYVTGILCGENEEELMRHCGSFSPRDLRKLRKIIYGRLGVVNDLQIAAWRALVSKKQGVDYTPFRDARTY